MRRAALLVFAALVAAGPVAAGAQLVPIEKAPAARPPAETRNAPAFRVGFVAEGGRETAAARVEPFRLEVERALRRAVTAVPFANERALIEALAGGRVDYAPLSAIGYGIATRLCDCVEPLAAPRDEDRAAGWHTVILAPKRAGLARPEDLAGRRLAISRDPAIGTRRLALMLLERAGLAGDRAPTLVEVDGPAAALAAALDGRADAAVVWSSLEGEREDGWSRGTLTEAVAAGRVRADDVTLVWSSPLLPLGPHTVRATIDEPTKRRLREMLIGLDVDPDVYAAIERTHSGGFVRVGAPSYRPFVDLLTPADEHAEPPAEDAAPPKG